MKRTLRRMVQRQACRAFKALALLYAVWMVIEYLLIMHHQMMKRTER